MNERETRHPSPEEEKEEEERLRKEEEEREKWNLAFREKQLEGLSPKAQEVLERYQDLLDVFVGAGSPLTAADIKQYSTKRNQPSWEIFWNYMKDYIEQDFGAEQSKAVFEELQKQHRKNLRWKSKG